MQTLLPLRLRLPRPSKLVVLAKSAAYSSPNPSPGVRENSYSAG